MAARVPAAAVDSLVMLRLELLERDTGAAQALAAAADAMRRGGDVSAVLLTARRALSGAVERQAGLSLWGRP